MINKTAAVHSLSERIWNNAGRNAKQKEHNDEGSAPTILPE